MDPARRFELLQLLERYEPAAGEERVHAEMQLLLRDPQDPFSRYSFQPGHFTAAGTVVSPERDAVLLVHHIRLKRWLQPGGHIDPDDASPAAAARREVREETGVALAAAQDELFDIDIHHIPSGKGEPPHHHYDLRFFMAAASDELRPAEAEVHDAQWVAFDAVADLTDERSLLQMVRKLAARLAG